MRYINISSTPVTDKEVLAIEPKYERTNGISRLNDSIFNLGTSFMVFILIVFSLVIFVSKKFGKKGKIIAICMFLYALAIPMIAEASSENDEYIKLQAQYEELIQDKANYEELVSYYDLKKNKKQSNEYREKIYRIDYELIDIREELKDNNYDFSKDETVTYDEDMIREIEPDFTSPTTTTTIMTIALIGLAIFVIFLAFKPFM